MLARVTSLFGLFYPVLKSGFPTGDATAQVTTGGKSPSRTQPSLLLPISPSAPNPFPEELVNTIGSGTSLTFEWWAAKEIGKFWVRGETLWWLFPLVASRFYSNQDMGELEFVPGITSCIGNKDFWLGFFLITFDFPVVSGCLCVFMFALGFFNSFSPLPQTKAQLSCGTPLITFLPLFLTNHCGYKLDNSLELYLKALRKTELEEEKWKGEVLQLPEKRWQSPIWLCFNSAAWFQTQTCWRICISLTWLMHTIPLLHNRIKTSVHPFRSWVSVLPGKRFS